MIIYRGSNQRVPEYHSWSSLCLGMGIKTYVELGCGSSHSQRDAGTTVVTVDLLPNGYGGVKHIQANTQEPATVGLVLDALGSYPECVFIDADHSYEGVKRDFDLWWPIATRLVGFHDILMPGVQEFWRETSRQYPSIEIISRDVASANAWQVGSNSNGDVNCGGIGAILKELL